ncbi:MBL fold metallo-hydrolase [Curtobacterium sp. VKM Ac-2889]|jgi:L-ascorbate metabolism protein UlaG (beta-lactamase superfamily)|uniref:MBL fold metallo-hydrolase n=1 Tax=Curtobacterium poinsettiae TaxID=159612 RepID=A0ABT3RYK4_9MICO|nr:MULTISPECIES: MBL fold metallo-hydrolase [Curtobacterium]MBF4598404.1 MBL fold metallo-hydrolase [Curtobacterium sp. VKM Ac-1796]MBF4611621.1 MBL fold metallo-hydrolase [Curtobacterium sp. VKM Ac-2889]MBT1598511.1 MBL fold metallo-hydrolase [Curtobacterium flaccumfaciens pv. flaccumfaciens]MBT1610240.1 MBL fold metallo-hydrolase [Curtobacterium flaccumfaciens pv. poinsettiae]MCS6565856.1 MBL fold metallo-hydrolase [Curtobacterium flaccumfaciens pv. flaccumfaciens]
MEVTKLEHACQIITEGNTRLVLDPGNFTRPVDVTGVVAVVVTHEHPDHVTPEQLHRILAADPDAVVFGPEGVRAALADSGIAVEVVTDGDHRTVGPFELSFHGTRHQLIHSSVPIVDNTGVLVNGRLFHPGDSYTDPGVPVEVLAAPVGAPWLKVGEMMDAVAAIAPSRAYPIHEATLSDIGYDMHTGRLREAVEPAGSLVVLRPGESLTI